MEEEIYHLYHREEDDWWWSVGRRALVHALWRRHGSRAPGRPRLLEVGCGTGGLLAELSAWADAHGLDVSEEAVAYCRKRGLRQICRASLNALPFPDASFDGVIATDVLEHLDDDRGALDEMHRVCRPGGTLIATVPAFRFLWSRRDEQLHHRRRYTRREFRDRVAAAGFRIEHSTYLNPHLFPPLVLLSLLGRFKREGHNLKVDYALVPGPINRIMQSVVRAEAGVVSRVALPIGTSTACVARRSPVSRPEGSAGGASRR